MKFDNEFEKKVIDAVAENMFQVFVYSDDKVEETMMKEGESPECAIEIKEEVQLNERVKKLSVKLIVNPNTEEEIADDNCIIYAGTLSPFYNAKMMMEEKMKDKKER